MIKVLPLEYKYVYFQSTDQLIQLGLKTYQSSDTPDLKNSLKDLSVESWISATVITGKSAATFFKKQILEKEFGHLFLIDPKPFMPKEILLDVLLAKKRKVTKTIINETTPTWKCKPNQTKK